MDTYHLDRFIEAQKATYATALSEIKKGKKQTHWMWYIFPQLAGLGFSSTAKFYGIKDLGEAAAFHQHPLLGSRLRELCTALLSLDTTDPFLIFGSPDHMKLSSSMTLFSLATHNNLIYNQVLQKFFNGTKDEKTVQLLSGV